MQMVSYVGTTCNMLRQSLWHCARETSKQIALTLRPIFEHSLCWIIGVGVAQLGHCGKSWSLETVDDAGPFARFWQGPHPDHPEDWPYEGDWLSDIRASGPANYYDPWKAYMPSLRMVVSALGIVPPPLRVRARVVACAIRHRMPNRRCLWCGLKPHVTLT